MWLAVWLACPTLAAIDGKRGGPGVAAAGHEALTYCSALHRANYVKGEYSGLLPCCIAASSLRTFGQQIERGVHAETVDQRTPHCALKLPRHLIRYLDQYVCRIPGSHDKQIECG